MSATALGPDLILFKGDDSSLELLANGKALFLILSRPTGENVTFPITKKQLDKLAGFAANKMKANETP